LAVDRGWRGLGFGLRTVLVEDFVQKIVFDVLAFDKPFRELGIVLGLLVLEGFESCFQDVKGRSDGLRR